MQELSLVKSVTISNDLDHLSFLLNLQVIPCDHRMSEVVGDSENLKILHDIQASQPVKIQYLKVSVILQPDEPLQSVVLPQGLSLSIVDLHNHPIVSNSISSLLEPNPDILSVQFTVKMGDIFELCLKFQEYSIHELIVV
ncbi:MAG: hypothetical protein EAZ61_03710 [Oscillatoriales cyanobacterium]|nr:MAG: hypothetical protein EAZ61_03710 [Oscillatoriales cyanobacterium]